MSCKKNAVQVIDGPPTGAYIKGYNFAISGPSVNFYANDTKISATSSATGKEATTGVNYSGTFPANNSYVVLSELGSVTFKTKIPSTASANPNGIVANVTANVEAGKYYSFFTSGIYDATAKTTSGFVLEDKLPAIDTAFAYVRMVNTISNTENGFSLKATNKTTGEVLDLTAPVPYKMGSTFIKVPNGVYNLVSQSVNPGVTHTITRNDVSFSKGFVYTMASRGNVLVANNTGLDLTRNR